MAVEKVAVYAGTFDPITFGHLDVIERASKVFDKIVVAVTTNPSKKPLFSLEERVRLVRECAKEKPFVEVDSFRGLLVDYLRKRKARIILRGMREISDFEREFQHASMNRKLCKEADTFFVMTSEKYYYISSSLVREIASLGGSVGCFVPEAVEKALRKKLAKK